MGVTVGSWQAVREVLGVFAWSRIAIWLVGVFALLVFVPNRDPAAAPFDSGDIHDLHNYALDVLARWDSTWYVEIAKHGYGRTPASANFFPLYPACVAIVGRALAGHYVVAGIVVSLASCLAAFALLFRIAEARLGKDGADRAVLYLAIFPMSLYLEAVYAESLYLMLVLLAFYLSERRRWLSAWGATGLAMLARSSGFALIPAMVILAWRSPDRRRAFAGAPLAPALFSLFPLALWRETGDPFGFLHAARLWGHKLSSAGPAGGLWDGIRAAGSGVATLVRHGPVLRTTAPVPGTTDFSVWKAAFDVEFCVVLLLFAVLAVLAWRQFGAAYGSFALVSLAVPLTEPVVSSDGSPLQDIPRYAMVVFPCLLALASLGRKPARHNVIVGLSALGLGLTIVQFALWQEI